MTELLPCPFCGGKVKLHSNGKEVVCLACECCGPFMDTEAEAIAAWNTRAVMGYEDARILLDELGLSERTCCNISGVPLKFRCSECGDVLGKPSIDEFNYCPNCGSKVVGE